MNSNNQDFSFEDEEKKHALIKRLLFEVDRDEAEAGSGRDRDVIFRELNAALGLPQASLNEDCGEGSMSIENQQALSDTDLEDMGGRRCVCGEPVFQLGIPNEQHCELDVR